jgi:fatty-acid desaturase
MRVVTATIIGFAIAELNIYLVSAVLHRGMCHRSIDFHPLLERAVCIWLWLTVCTSPLSWIAAHKQHHANSDTERDPHAPGIKGFWRVLLLTWYYVTRWYRANRPEANRRYLRGWRQKRLFMILEQPSIIMSYFYLQLLVSSLLGPPWIAFWLARYVTYLLASGYVNAVGHTFGERPYGRSGTDSVGRWQKVAGYLMGGEPLGHNYHHRYPMSPTFCRSTFDPGFWFAVQILCGVPRDHYTRLERQ